MDAKEIIKAIRCCHVPDMDCHSCPCDCGGEDCNQISTYAADLIERQAAELAKYRGVGEKYEREIERLTRERDAAVRDLTKAANMAFLCPYCKLNGHCALFTVKTLTSPVIAVMMGV